MAPAVMARTYISLGDTEINGALMNRFVMLRGRSGNGPSTTSTTRRRAKWLAVIAALALPLALVVAPMAEPRTARTTSTASFPTADVDRDYPTTFGNVKELGPLNSNTTKIGVIHNDAVPTLGLTNPNAQVDLRRAWLDTEKDTGAPNHDWLYFAWERDNNSGSGFIAYEFMQNPAPAACAYDTATEDVSSSPACNPWANRTSRRLHDPLGPAGRQQGPATCGPGPAPHRT